METGHRSFECPRRRFDAQAHFVEPVEGEQEDDDIEGDPVYDDDGGDEHEEGELEADEGESLLIRRAMYTPKVKTDERWLRTKIFRTRCTSGGKVCNVIIDSGSCENMVSKEMVEKLNLKCEKDPRPAPLFV